VAEGMSGQSVDRYQIAEELGRGGMGVVYRARDTLLDRFVALKVLPPDKSSDPERRQRFLQEAKAASALNHPGIVAVHDVLTHEGQDVIVMELVEGETLEQLLARKRPGLGEALGLAAGIANALARAHAAGIVHRDLKPSNVMVTPAGVKVLDFGLAKLTEAPFSDAEAPTLALGEPPLTREVAILGTIGWMSPEQASGGAIDTRSDIFAFGVLLYEMLTGHHPFRRDTTQGTLSAIREEEPEPPTKLSPSLPPEAERAVLRCLRKDPSRRWQSLSDLGAVLRDLREDTVSGRTTVTETVAPARRQLPLWLLATLAIVVLAGTTVAVLLLRAERRVGQPLELRRLTYDSGASLVPGISPDGNLVAFTSDRGGGEGFDIWVRHINQPEPIRLTDHPADDWQASFSPDGSQIVFRSQRDGGGVYVVNTLGGGLRRVAERGQFPRFSPDGSRILYSEDPFWSPSPFRRFFAVPAKGGSPEPIVPGWGALRPPGSAGAILSPDGRHALFSGAPVDDPRRQDWWVAPLDGGDPWSSGAREALPQLDLVQFPIAWLPDRLLLVAGTTIEGMNLYQAGISEKGRISGPVEPLTAGPGMTWLPSVSQENRIALSRFQWVVNLFEIELDPEHVAPRGAPRRITEDAAPKFGLALSADGRRLVYSTYAGSPDDRRAEVRVQDAGSETLAASVTLNAATTNPHPRISPDGRLFSWRDRLGGTWGALVASVEDPVGRELCRECVVVDFFSDGEHALVDHGRSLTRTRLSDGEESLVLDLKEGALLDSDLSRDDRWIAIQVGEKDGSVVLYAVPLRSPPAGRGEWVRLAGGETWAGQPRWSPDGRSLFHLSERDDFTCVWALVLDPETREPVGESRAVLHAHQTSMKMMPVERSMWTLDVGGDRLVFNAGAMSGDVYTAKLDER
jgi:serine/threonine protein kinase/Tol biopolymer transport system component